ncbi:MAG: hypothetical protein LCH60_14695 [Actinobacteria bacterium]|nr:hypothetical protein [Actinomycetota bacterium]
MPDATAYYDEIDPKLGDRLSELIVHAINQIEAHPLVFAEYVTGFRRVVLVPFPYLLAYAVHDDAINIDALLHVKRDPATNERILRSRG